VLDKRISWENDLTRSAEPADEGQIESCSDILARTSGKDPMTDDNVGSQWRYAFRLE